MGYQSLAGSLFVQASLQAPGFALRWAAPARGLVGYPITSIEMLSVLSNTQVLVAHTLGLIVSLRFLQRNYRAT